MNDVMCVTHEVNNSVQFILPTCDSPGRPTSFGANKCFSNTHGANKSPSN